jgi:hypothetical protein
MINSHAFEPYFWTKSICGYVDGDDMMCGYQEPEHVSPKDHQFVPYIFANMKKYCRYTYEDDSGRFLVCNYSEVTMMIKGHAFEPYQWDKFRCGYVLGDSICGFPESYHGGIRQTYRIVEHIPQWTPAKSGFICTYKMENGNQCPGNVFSLDHAVGLHACVIDLED